MIHVKYVGFYDNGITVEASPTGPFRLLRAEDIGLCVWRRGWRGQKTDLLACMGWALYNMLGLPSVSLLHTQ